MLELKNIKKDYKVASGVTHAVRGVSLNFRRNEFVSILGPSGGGKTTLLNIIGGLDRYTTGDIIIEGKSTKEYKSRDWDAYRNHSIGFVFQSYNLIMHQNVLANVEMALTISGISSSKRKELARKALIDVGLENEINKMPNQLSGGQMQRVAIARALVNNPEVMLADEPTGALDSKTSVQILDLIKKIADDRLVIVVTHNAELAHKYSTRLIELHDGLITSDSNPYSDEESLADFNREQAEKKQKEEEELKILRESVDSDKEFELALKKKAKEEKRKRGRVKMTFLTALNLSFKNLWTKKGRTTLVAFAGSIGIIGIALVLSISDGFNSYVKEVQGDALTQYPLSINRDSYAIEDVIMPDMEGATPKDADIEKHKDGDDEYYKVSQNGFFSGFVNKMVKTGGQNDLGAFKNWLEGSDEVKDEDGKVIKPKVERHLVEYEDHFNGVQYLYDTDFLLYKYDKENDKYKKCYPVDYRAELENDVPETFKNSGVLEMLSMFEPTVQLVDEKILKDQFDVIDGHLPESAYEGVIILDKFNRIPDYVCYALGLKEPNELTKILNGTEEVDTEHLGEAYDNTDKLLNLEYKMPLTIDQYARKEVDPSDPPGTVYGYYYDKANDDFINSKIKNSKEDEIPTFKIKGILRPKKDATTTFVTAGIGYTAELSEELLKRVENNETIKEILNSNKPEDFCIYDLANIDFASLGITMTLPANSPCFQWSFLVSMLNSPAFKDKLPSFIQDDDPQTMINNIFDSLIKPALKVGDSDSPRSIRIYPKTFEDKDAIVEMIDDYNKYVKEQYKGNEKKIAELQITYTDSVATMMKSITTIINSITYVLIAFVSVSLIVSSIMIGIITYVSVIERTKEIGILRSLGASKFDVSNIFNAETFIIGLASGLLGVIIAFVLNFPINLLIGHLTGIGTIAKLRFLPALILVIISMLLTIIAGLFPSRVAAKRDPVIALRSGD